MPKKAEDTPVVDADALDPTANPDGSPTPHGTFRQEHGAQVHLTGLARAAARGGVYGDVVANTMARDAEVAAGRAADGSTPDGSTPDGRLPPDVLGGADVAVYGEPGAGEGQKGSRPGDQKVAQAQLEADKDRSVARQTAVEQATDPAKQ